ncbi:MAG: L-ascorbate metabolism protein UlaG (beta-lactamase superfamily) [Marinoscillum sp.]|jgi:L-ascorbate metabolism protein UlaG (beta-lactamase superfamily)
MVKKTFKALLLGITLIFIVGVIFVSFSPQFGQPPKGEDAQKVEESSNFREGQFQNLIETKMDYSLSNIIGMLKETSNAINTSPSSAIETAFDSSSPNPTDSILSITWYGHSAILLELAGQRIFLDPMLGDAASPLPIFGPRFGNNPSFDIDQIGDLDVVVFSHDHYDHLDYPTIKAIKDRVGHFIVPLGLGSHLRSWGVEPKRITELDWWETTTISSFSYTAAPARHFSGRGIGDSNSTLWASWVIKNETHSLYFSGDGGYGPHFKEIGEKHGPFDFAMMECGQYNKRWEAIHMMPEQTVQATIDLKAERMMPVHWGAFALSPHPWYEPAERVKIAAEKQNVQLVLPQIGKRISPLTYASNEIYWWRLVD